MQGGNPIDFIFYLAILIMSVVIHEISHGYAAYFLGDHTAEYENRLSLNPMRHFDLMGSLVVPVLTMLLGGVVFGWAKPVPYNPYNLKNQKWGPALVGIAGPLSNFLTAFVFGLFVRYGNLMAFLPLSFIRIASYIVLVNITLGVFNLLPIPPLDGSKLLYAILPFKWRHIEYAIDKYGIFVLMALILLFPGVVSYTVNGVLGLFVRLMM